MIKLGKNKISLVFIVTLLLSMFTVALSIQPAKAANPLDPTTIPKYVTPLIAYIPVYTPTNVTVGGVTVRQDYYVNVTQFSEQILPAGFPMTTVWGYGGRAHDPLTGADLGYFRNSPSATFDVIRNVPTKITWVNNLTDGTVSNNLLNYLYPIDPTFDWANPNNIPVNNAIQQAEMGLAPPYKPGYNGSAILANDVYTNPNQWNANSPVPIVTHVHGAEVYSGSDGGPNEWFTPNGLHGMDYYTYEPTFPNAAVYYYNNTQDAATLWYHDHAMGLTRINVFSGLAGYYLIRDPADTIAPLLPSGAYDVPLAIQDRSFYDNGSLRFDIDSPPNPNVHPYWVPEYFGDTFMVNGKTWPYFNVNQTTYRFRLLDGCNARFLDLGIIDLDNDNETVPFTLFARDQGYLNAPVPIENMLIGPGMRAEILVNFTGIPTGHRLLLKNSAIAPYPSGDEPLRGLTDEIMMFKVGGADAKPQHNLPESLNPILAGETWPTLPANSVSRQRLLTLRELEGEGGPLMVTLDGQHFMSPTTEMPVNGTTETWMIANPTADAHPMHWHLVQFQLVSRQPFDDSAYLDSWSALNGPMSIAGLPHPTYNLGNISAYYTDPAIPAPPEEQGWLDTVTMLPGQVTTIRIRYLQQNGSAYPFDPTTGPGYVWHCHIVDHEDNDMMRRQIVINAADLPPVYAAVRGITNAIWYRTFSFGTSSWGSWVSLPTQTTLESPATVQVNGILYFAVKEANGLSLRFGSVNLTSNAFSGWTTLNGLTSSAPTLVKYGSSLVLVYRDAATNIVYYNSYDTATGVWSIANGVGKTTSDRPAAAVAGDYLHFVVRGFSTTNVAINKTMYYANLNLATLTLTTWEVLPGATDAAPALTNPENQNLLYLVVKGLDNRIYFNVWDGTEWQGWTILPTGLTTKGPGATVINGELQILVRSALDDNIWQLSINLANGAESSWGQTGGLTPSTPTLSR